MTRHHKTSSLLMMLLFSVPVAANSIPEANWTSYASCSKRTHEGDDIYFVINSGLSKEQLDRSIAMLRKKGIIVQYDQITYNRDGLLSSIDVRIDISAAGKPTATYRLTENTDDHSFQPLIFYWESGGANAGFVKGVPTNLSERGKQVVDNNLEGLLILNNNSMEVSGKIRKTWN